MSNPDNSPARQEGASSHSRRQILKASASLASLPLLAMAASGVRAAQSQAAAPAAAATDAGTDAFINGMADLMAHSTRTPILRWPNEYGMEYEEIFFPAMDGVTIEGWFIPGNSDRLLIFNHPMPCNRYGYPGHLAPWQDFGGFEVNFLPEYKILHDAGFAIAKGPADSGALVILNSRHQDSLDRAVAALSSEVPSAMGAFVLVASEFRVVEAASADDSRATSG